MIQLSAESVPPSITCCLSPSIAGTEQTLLLPEDDASGPPLSLTQFRALDFLSKMDSSLPVCIEGPPHSESVAVKSGEE